MAIDVLIAYTPDIHAPPSVSGGAEDRFMTFFNLGTASRRLTGDDQIQFVSLAIFGYQSIDASGVGTDNTGNVYIGGLDYNGGKILPSVVTPGGEIVINAPVGKSFHLTDLWVKADTGTDGLVIELS